jgi:RimJ/RimL family protein N-acetyltransferase
VHRPSSHKCLTKVETKTPIDSFGGKMAEDTDAPLKASVKSTLPSTPLPPNSTRVHVNTERLLLRPVLQSDLEAMHVLRSQPEAMTGTTLGVPDKTMEETQAALDFFLPPNDAVQFLFGIFLRSTGELIGEGGVHNLKSSVSGWPEIGYKLRKEFWGQGLATEFLRGFLSAWWDLPRAVVEIDVHAKTREGDDETTVEKVYANTELDNRASQRVLEKVGFGRFHEWTEPDTQLHRLGEPLTLVGYILPRPNHE